MELRVQGEIIESLIDKIVFWLATDIITISNEIKILL